jgi:hypothetical protein
VWRDGEGFVGREMGRLLNFWSSLNGINEFRHEQMQNDRFGLGTKGVALEILFSFLDFWIFGYFVCFGFFFG